MLQPNQPNPRLGLEISLIAKGFSPDRILANDSVVETATAGKKCGQQNNCSLIK
jgi:hypothetical protein